MSRSKSNTDVMQTRPIVSPMPPFELSPSRSRSHSHRRGSSLQRTARLTLSLQKSSHMCTLSTKANWSLHRQPPNSLDQWACAFWCNTSRPCKLIKSGSFTVTAWFGVLKVASSISRIGRARWKLLTHQSTSRGAIIKLSLTKVKLIKAKSKKIFRPNFLKCSHRRSLLSNLIKNLAQARESTILCCFR